LSESLLNFLEKALGEKWTPEAGAAWTKTLSLVTQKIGEGLDLGVAEK